MNFIFLWKLFRFLNPLMFSLVHECSTAKFDINKILNWLLGASALDNNISLQVQKLDPWSSVFVTGDWILLDLDFFNTKKYYNKYLKQA